MAFESLKRMFGMGKRQDTESSTAGKAIIDSEIDSLERDIQEYIDYTDSRKRVIVGASNDGSVPEKLSIGGGSARAENIKKAAEVK